MSSRSRAVWWPNSEVRHLRFRTEILGLELRSEHSSVHVDVWKRLGVNRWPIGLANKMRNLENVLVSFPHAINRRRASRSV